MDTDPAHALIRFGLGRKLGEAVPRDPGEWLRAQLEGSDPDLARAAPTIQQMLAALELERQEGKTPGQPSRVKLLWKPELASIMTTLVETAAPFRERLVWFWANHFTVSLRHGDVLATVGPYLREAIRPHVTGRFVDLLMAVMTHPAMLKYLDNSASVGPDSPAGQKKHAGLNENLARECLELHTVTPESGYTQADVTAFAAILTGWSVDTHTANPGFVFRDHAHEPGTQSLMGRRYPPGLQGGVQALTWLGEHPATYRNVATKLVRHFVADDPPPAAVARVQAVLSGSGGDLKQACLALLDLPPAWEPLRKLRTPFDFVPAALRATGYRPPDMLQVAQWLGMLGQQPFSAPLPNGWPDHASDWTGGEALLRRVDWSWAVSDRMQAEPAEAIDTALGPLASAETAAAVRRAGSRREALTLLLASPEFARR